MIMAVYATVRRPRSDASLNVRRRKMAVDVLRDRCGRYQRDSTENRSLLPG